jgi:hypothetical protein
LCCVVCFVLFFEILNAGYFVSFLLEYLTLPKTRSFFFS